MTQPGTTPTRPRRAAGCLQSIVVLAVILGLGYGASKIFGDDSSTSKSSSSSSSASDGKGGSWEIGDCGGPDPENKPDGYRAYDCDESGATFKALELKPASFMPDSIQCPAGTDLIIQVSRVFGSGDGKKGGGIPTHTVCGRNLSDDHPGDAGAGGGQLVEGDCISATAKEITCASAGAEDFKVLGLVKDKKECPAATTEPMQLMMAIGRPYDVICGGKV
ncbi:hypothetical protein ACFYUM_29895 [Streptomyces fimicarius]|uniref:Secreted protein n=2 Tax=Streptomyces griseus group TaxID=629295 RepID=A0ABW2MJY9_9ACTN|nr:MULTISPECIES: hypothetical protein [Streptomyces]MCL6292018.1 hypothetical protein [Streptomyces sp. 43Y-GA-1]MCX4709326.1 hypothetical protein [Streptomyces griseus]MDX2672181.1 hypothetical protein [Streptomyces sp. NRRL_ISP-5395]MDX3339902.1 hypothetical protein [Streptomyces sp. ME02-6979.5a]MDX3503623.1 hypothetical protein [Streptomyces sp. ATCC51928]